MSFDWFSVANPLSVSAVSSVGGGFCNFRGVDGSEVVVADADVRHPVDPPQAQISGSCDVL